MAIALPKAAQSSGEFASGGSGKFKSLRKKAKSTQASGYNPFEPKYDRMSFKASQDPVYKAFEYLDNQPISKLAADFVKENITMPMNRACGTLLAAIA